MLNAVTGEFSMWLGNIFNYETRTWGGHAGALTMGVNLTLIKAGIVKQGKKMSWFSNEKDQLLCYSQIFSIVPEIIFLVVVSEVCCASFDFMNKLQLTF